MSIKRSSYVISVLYSMFPVDNIEIVSAHAYVTIGKYSHIQIMVKDNKNVLWKNE